MTRFWWFLDCFFFFYSLLFLNILPGCTKPESGQYWKRKSWGFFCLMISSSQKMEPVTNFQLCWKMVLFSQLCIHCKQSFHGESRFFPFHFSGLWWGQAKKLSVPKSWQRAAQKAGTSQSIEKLLNSMDRLGPCGSKPAKSSGTILAQLQVFKTGTAAGDGGNRKSQKMTREWCLHSLEVVGHLANKNFICNFPWKSEMVPE